MSWHDIINTVLMNVKPILKFTFISTLILLLILLFIYPKTYQSSVSILPPEKENNLGGLSSLLSGGELSNLFSNSSTKFNSQLYMEILKSRSASQYVVRKLNLFNYLNSDDIQEAASRLLRELNLDLSKEGIVTVSVNVKSGLFPLIFSNEDSLKKLSASISNTFIEALDKINNDKLSTRAKRARQFIENQLVSTKASLDSAENNLMVFQMKNKTVSLPDQLKSSIENATRLKSQITEIEIQLGLLRYNVQEESKIVSALEKKLSELKDQYKNLDFGDEDYLLAFNKIPELGKKLASLLREVKIQNELYLFLQQQYYREKIQENKDIPTIEVLDEAIPPLKPSSPRIIYSSLVGGIFILIMISLFFILKVKVTYLPSKSLIKKNI